MNQNPIPDVERQALEHAINFNNEFGKLIESNVRFEEFGCSLMAETLQKWAARDPQVSARLKRRLAKPRCPLEMEVAVMMSRGGGSQKVECTPTE
ncbi:hypothetical protein Pmar_PMAR024514 [Perkinsus marinus ATCC 50983]|uniref:Uncharacterized protein n=1 Tax=Perkinsus marinus (strain ATCC 50983 / TXsc) TaxID=423536 RepID=C5LT70_PERM5|nr:hypothetical protein Pmar_PMAR024514 [Perkinsus marinus ATCC 50983]EER00038.1 hypothetical protein Pmar_PMAR024514 [Perkinsus marinus ATCC 50983]|eukprot:XP_002767320.1 hypothetical protein Pmar_PMAR024514 [Perkinsus marinus ATCC 50983]